MAVRALLHYALEIPDLSVGERFYQNFGLRDRPTRDEAVHLGPARLPRASVLLLPGPKKRLHHLAFGAPTDDFSQVQEAIQRTGVREVDPPAGAIDGGMWIRDPDGNLLNIRDEGPLTPPADAPLALNSPLVIPRVRQCGAALKPISSPSHDGWDMCCCSHRTSIGSLPSIPACWASSCPIAVNASSPSYAAPRITITWLS